MNLFVVAGMAVSVMLLPCAAMCLRGSADRRLAGLELAGTLVTLAMTLFLTGWARPALIDLPLSLAIMSFGGSLVYARFLGKHL